MSKRIIVSNLDGTDGGSTDIVTQITIKELKKNKEDFFKLSPNSNSVFICNGYDKSYKEYTITNYETGQEKYIKSDRKIYIGFTY